LYLIDKYKGCGANIQWWLWHYSAHIVKYNSAKLCLSIKIVYKLLKKCKPEADLIGPG